MANWYGHKMTRIGQDLLAVLNSRELPLKITSVRMGSGTLGSQTVVDLKALIKQELSLEVAETPKRAGDGRWNITAIYNNSMIQTGFYFREWGVFAQDPDTLDEVLVFYANSGDSADYIPAFDGSGSSTSSYIEEQLICACTAGNAEVTAVLSSAQYALAEDLQDHVNNKSNPHAVTKDQVGLGNVDNTKQAPYTHVENKSNPHGVTKAQVGLGSVDNTSDVNKPVSTAQQAAIDACKVKKAALSLPAASWAGSASPYTQSVTIDGITVNSKVDLQMDSTAIGVMVDSGTTAIYIANNNGTLTAYAVGEKPTADLSVQVTITEVTA